jgi:hypothetical protein
VARDRRTHRRPKGYLEWASAGDAEARQRPRNVAVTLERISQEEYEQLVREAARG